VREDRQAVYRSGKKRKRTALGTKDTSTHMQLRNISGSPTFHEKNLQIQKGTMSTRRRELEKGKGRKIKEMLYRGFFVST
jgi:hypothetical protein